MRTSQLFVQDTNNAITMLYSLRFDSIKSLAAKRPPVAKQTLAPSNPKNPKHAQVLSESGITYDTPLDPMKVAEIRAQRIQREKAAAAVCIVQFVISYLFPHLHSTIFTCFMCKLISLHH